MTIWIIPKQDPLSNTVPHNRYSLVLSHQLGSSSREIERAVSMDV